MDSSWCDPSQQALPFTSQPFLLTWSQTLFPTMPLLFAQSLHVTGCVLPCLPPPRSPSLAFQPGGFLHTLPYNTWWLPGKHRGFSLLSWCFWCCNRSQCLGSAISRKFLLSFCSPTRSFPSKLSLGISLLWVFYCVGCTHWGDVCLILWGVWVFFSLSFIFIVPYSVALGFFFCLVHTSENKTWAGCQISLF